MSEIIYQDEHCTIYKGCDGYTFNEICKKCKHTMDNIHEDGRNTYGFSYIYWCPNCGTILRWYDGNKIEENDWQIPKNT